MEDILLRAEGKMETGIEVMLDRFANIRAGRANSAILDRVMVSYYGIDTPLKQLANISIPEARQLLIKPFDRTSLGAIEKAIYESNIGLTPNNNGEIIILTIPALTEETRREYVKQVKAIAEECKVGFRKIRQEANDQIKKSDGSEDEVKKGIDEVQTLINQYNKKVEESLKNKEEDLMVI